MLFGQKGVDCSVKISKTSAIKAIKDLPGITARSTECGEIRVNYKMGNESTAYYTDDAQDALDTAKMMHNNPTI